DAEAILDDPEPELSPEPILEPLPEAAGEEELRPEELHQMPQPPPVSADPFKEPHGIGGRPYGQGAGSREEEEARRRIEELSLDEVRPEPAPQPTEEEPLEIDHQRVQSRAGGDTASQSLMREEPTFDHTLEQEPAAADANRDLRKKLTARGMRNLGARPPQPEVEGGKVEPAQRPSARQYVDESKLSKEELFFVAALRSRAKLAPKQNAYARPGVSPQAPADQIKAAYLTLAKKFHPDAASKPGLSALTPELQSLFALLKEAYESISTADLR